MRLPRFAPLFFLVLLVFTIQPVHAAAIDLTKFDDNLGEALGIGTFGGGLLATLILLFTVLGCLGAAMRRQPSTLMVIIVSFSVFSFGIAATWFPVWSLTFIILLVAILYGKSILGVFK